MIDKLILEDFRCFAGRQEILLAPLTVLVGENSTGKSSFLAATRIAWDLGSGIKSPDFNEEPFLLGAWEQIANFRGGRAGRAKAFTIGCEIHRQFRRAQGEQPVRVSGCFMELESQPYVANMALRSDEFGITYSFEPDGSSECTIVTPKGSHSGKSSQPRRSPSAGGTPRGYPWEWFVIRSFAPERTNKRERNDVFDELSAADFDSLLTMTRTFQDEVARPYALAPIRSRPKRTYDLIADTPDPEGQHIPVVLSRMLTDTGNASAELNSRLEEFGKASGLFSKVAVRRFGKSGDPFQLVAQVSGRERNLIDVGYGVSQVLPIIVEIVTHRPGGTFCIQQPEVHLHPRAQAALATLLAQLVKEKRCQVFVETHSDYFIDRLKIDLRNGEMLRPEDVGLLYFEADKSGSRVYSISVDRLGNVIGAPTGYRRFFLDEENRFLGIA